jgi:glycosyltransferase involved in cell wall biosynthesis
VVIPTYRRPAELKKTLEAYRTQTEDKKNWEIILVDEGSGPEFNVDGIAQSFSASLPIKYIAQAVNTGSAQARKTAIPQATGDLILFAGDDVVPDHNLVREHRAAHRGMPSEKTAILGHVGWDRDVAVSELMDYVTGEGGQLFSYFKMDAYQPVPGRYFYTSNVSAKRGWIASQGAIFDPDLAGGCVADLGASLSRAGMTLYFNPDAYAFLNRFLSDEAIYQRQYQVGRAMARHSLSQPSDIGELQRERLDWLEMLALMPESESAAKFEEQDDSFTSLFARVGLGLESCTEIDLRIDRAREVGSARTRELAGSAGTDGAVRRLIMSLQLEFSELCGMAEARLGDNAPSRSSLYAWFMRRWHLGAASGRLAASQSGRLSERTQYIETLRADRPMAASVLRSVVRIATSVAKRMNYRP